MLVDLSKGESVKKGSYALEVAFCLTFLLGNSRDYKKWGLDKITFVSAPHSPFE
jgi:hypothetical protein